MLSFDQIQAYRRLFSQVACSAELGDLLDTVTREMGFAFFALTHHVDIRRHPDRAIRLSNYPGDWVDYYDANALGTADPVHRASHVTNLGFPWSRIPRLIVLTKRDREILRQGGKNGIGDGFTVPTHIPGESHGSCSFANPAGVQLQDEVLPLAELVGHYAFDAARRIWEVRPRSVASVLTERQKQCVALMAAGKTDWEIGHILGIAEETVTDHLNAARIRYGGGRRTSLVTRALYDTSITFPEVFQR